MKFDYKALARSDCYKSYKQGLHNYLYKCGGKYRKKEANLLFRRFIHVLIQEFSGDLNKVVYALKKYEKHRDYAWLNYYSNCLGKYRNTTKMHPHFYRQTKCSKKVKLAQQHYRARKLRESSGKKPRRRSL